MFTQALDSSKAVPRPHFLWLRDCFLIGMGSILIALCAPVAITLPFTPIPLALAPHLCLALGAVLGSRRGALTVSAYLLQGIAGFPVFALGTSGLSHLLGPRGGYLLGYVAAAYVTGYVIEHMQKRTSFKTFLAFVAGNGVIYLLGALQLSLFVGCKDALLLGVLPFMLGDACKILLLHTGIRNCLNQSDPWEQK